MLFLRRARLALALFCSRKAIFLLLCAFAMIFGCSRANAQRPYGIDVSGAQGSGLNWVNIKNGGISFAWAKATEGQTFLDPDFVINENGAAAAGVLIGAYHYARYDNHPGTNGAIAEAGWYWQNASNYIKTNGAYLMPMLDMEAATTGYDKTTLSQWANAWCQAVVRMAASNGVAVTPVIYTSASFGSAWFDSSMTQWIPWIASWKNGQSPQTGGPTPSTSPWPTWTVWQFDDTNTMFSGPPASCDVDVFNGTMTQLTNALVVGKVVPGALAGVTNYWDPGLTATAPGSGGSGTWNTNTANWWRSGPSNVVWSPGGDHAVFAGATGTATLGLSLAANSLTFSNANHTVAGSSTLTMVPPANIVTPSGFSNAITCVLGGAGFNVSGGGILYLNNGGNTSEGQTVTGPNTTLVVATDHDTGNTSQVLTLKSGGIYEDLDPTANDQFMLAGCTVSLGAGGGIFENPNANLIMSNAITGSGSLTYLGTTRTLTLSNAASTYNGGTIVQAGTLKAAITGSLGATTGALTVNGGTLDLGGASHTAGTVTIAGGTISGGTLTGSAYAGQSGTVSALLAGSGAMTKSTAGILTLSGTNTYTGITSITGGLLQINADARLGAAPVAPVANQVTLNNGGITSGLRCNGSFTFSANRGITVIGTGGSVQVTTGFIVNYPNVITGNGSLGIGSGFNVGYGTNVFSGANTYTGTTTIAAGTLQLGADGTLPLGTPLTIGADGNTGGGAVLDMNGHSQTIGPLASSTGIGGTGTDTPTIRLTGALTIRETNASTVFAGVISGSGGSLTLNGNSTLTLSGANTYTGSTTISAGTLALGSGGSINNTAMIGIGAGAVFDVSAIPAYTIGAGTTLSAGGTASAVINGGTTVSLGTQPLILAYDGTHPPLSIPQGALSLNGNPITVINLGPALGQGTYVLIQQASGNIASSGTCPVTVTGGGLTPTSTASISVVGGTANLVVVTPPPSFAISSGSIDATGSNFVLSWQSIPGTNYQVVSSPDVSAPLNTWTNVGGLIMATDTNTSATNPITSAAAFFDVIRE